MNEFSINRVIDILISAIISGVMVRAIMIYSLERRYFEYQVRFSRLHQHRADVMFKLFQDLVELNSKAKLLASSPVATKADFQAFENEVVAFENYFLINSIFLDEQYLCQVKDIVEQFHQIDNSEVLFGYVLGAKITQHDIPFLLNRLKNDFQHELGIRQSSDRSLTLRLKFKFSDLPWNLIIGFVIVVLLFFLLVEA